MNRRLWVVALSVAVVAVAAGFFLWPSKPPAGAARFRLPGPKGAGVTASPYMGKADLHFTVRYDGPRSGFEITTQTWKGGKPTLGTGRGSDGFEPARSQRSFTIQDRPLDGKLYYAVTYTARQTGLLGGSSTSSFGFTESIPDPSSPWICTLAPQGPVDLSEGPFVPLWGIFGHRERLDLPPGASLEALASKVDWAILIVVRLYP